MKEAAPIKGTLDVLVLKALSCKPMHRLEITSWLLDRSAGGLDVEHSALYQALSRLEERGLICAQWGVTEKIRRARYYSLTTDGRNRLTNESPRMLSYAEGLAMILKSTKQSRA
jgi:DNA-binding PadR family transcriptional regulator